MTKDKFRELCRQVLIPYLGDFMQQQLIELHRSLDELTAEVLRISRRIDWIVGQIGEQKKHEGR